MVKGSPLCLMVAITQRGRGGSKNGDEYPRGMSINQEGEARRVNNTVVEKGGGWKSELWLAE